MQVLRLGAMCNDGSIVEEDGALRHIGDPTETAIVAAARLCGFDKAELDSNYPPAWLKSPLNRTAS
jgi:Ca2+-transporting ATPase